MTTTRSLRFALIAGHAAVAMLGLAAMTVPRPAAHAPRWEAAGMVASAMIDVPRRIPATRRAGRLAAAD